jgi:phosphatidylserine/phosphatidylglycerophosphate/cardiolipin synthase-like enzyme
VLRTVVIVAAFITVLAGPVGVTASEAHNSSAVATVTQPQIVALYPNPVATGDSGEFVTVRFPPGTNRSAYSLTDGETTIRLSTAGIADETITVVFSTDPNQTRALVDRPVAPLAGSLALANDGESVRLRRNGTVVDEVRYGSAGEMMRYDVRADRWRPLGATDRPVVTAGSGTVEAFVLPDNPDRATDFLAGARERVLLAGYTLSSMRVVEALTRAIERGVRVEVLVDGAPVGGMTGRAAAALDNLARAGATVRVVGGERSWYRYQHAKYAVVDDRALVTTENWKPAGTGGASSRGWGVITGQEPVVTGLIETFRADTDPRNTRPWEAFDPKLTTENRSTGDYPQRFDPESVPANQTHLLVAPDNARAAILDRIRAAEESIDVLQVSIGDRSFAFLQAVLDAAERGVEVRILLSGAWYVEEQNSQLVAWLDEQASTAALPLSAKLAEPGGAFEKIHAKGVIIDNETVILGSINWNQNSVQNNREVALILDGRAVADYFGEVFAADWQDDDSSRDVPLGLALAGLFAAALAVHGARRISFGSEPQNW